MWSPSCSAESTTRPLRDLPIASRSAGSSIPWSTEFRTKWTSGSARASTRFLSRSVSSPTSSRLISFFNCRAKSRTRRGQVGHCLGHGLVATVEPQTHQAVTHQHQFADHVHDLVQACGSPAPAAAAAGARAGAEAAAAGAAAGAALAAGAGVAAAALAAAAGAAAGLAAAGAAAVAVAVAATSVNLPLPCNSSSRDSNS